MESVNNKLAASSDVLPRSSVDTLLLPYLRAETDEESEQSLHQIISEHVDPVVREAAGRRLRRVGAARSNDAAQMEDIRSDVLVHLLARLRKLKAARDEEPIENLRGYVAQMTTHACYRYLRRKHPQRHILKDKLRYLLMRQSGFSMWESVEGEATVGFSAWRSSDLSANAERLETLMRDPSGCVPAELSSREAGRTRPAALLAAIFDYLGGALPFDDLVNIVARLWGIEDQVEADEETLSRVADTRASAGAELEAREYLRYLWEEIKQLPVRQRAALLLNLREEQGRSCIALLPLMGIAAMRQIAEALEISAAQLAELWKHLPMDDARIASRLQLTRQQVINLRKSARERLSRRMRAFG